MSKVVCHVAKFQRPALSGLQHHDQRTQKNPGNKDIDAARSCQNYDLQNPDRRIKFSSRIDEIISTQRKNAENAPKIRKDAVLCVDVLVSSEKAFFDKLNASEQRKYFEDAHEILKNHFGSENVISATVHMDEKTPHMHWKFVPITKGGKLSGKDVINQTTLRELQRHLPQELQRRGWDIERGIENNDTRHVQPEEYKKALAKEINELEKRQKRHSQETWNAYKLVNNMEQTAKKIPLTDKYAVRGDDLETLYTMCQGAEKQIRWYGKRDVESRKAIEQLKKYIEEAQTKNQILENETTTLKTKLLTLQKEKLTLSKEKSTAEKDLNVVKRFLKTSPDTVEQLRLFEEKERKNRTLGR